MVDVVGAKSDAHQLLEQVRFLVRPLGRAEAGERPAAVASVNGAVTAPEPMPSISAATEDAWHRRVQWSTLFEPKPVRTSFWKR